MLQKKNIITALLFLFASLCSAGLLQADESLPRTVAMKTVGMVSGAVASLPERGAASSLDFSPTPLVQAIINGVKTIKVMVKKELKNRDRLVIRCLNEKLSAAVETKDQVPEFAPSLAQGLVAEAKGASTTIPGATDLDMESRKMLIGAVRTVGQLVAEARMCKYIVDGLSPSPNQGQGLKERLEGYDDVPEYPDFVQTPPEEVLFPVSRIHAGVSGQ